MDRSTPDTDVVIIGGGPAGSAMAAYLAKAGVRCTVLERALFPRPHVGESLVPSSTRVFRELDFLDKMEEGGFQRKYGAIWTSAFSKQTLSHEWEGLSPADFVDIRFDERKQVGVDKSYTWHVDRGRFDNLLLQHAQELGATVCEGVSVTGVDFGDPSCVRVKFEIGKKEVSLTARIVIDASGRATLLGRQLDLKVRDSVFDQVALHSWFEGYKRTDLVKKPEQEGYIHVHFLPIRNSWIWQIPITDEITSIGIVTQKKNFASKSGEREAIFWETVKTRPEIEQALRAAKRVRPFSTEGDYSYAMKRLTGDRFLLVGDAARFVDPIFSTGVSIALNCARFASQAVIAALASGDCSEASFKEYEETVRRGTRNWYRFIGLYYRLNIVFTAFILDPRYRVSVLKLLQGDVYDEDAPEVLDVMQKRISEVEQDPNHPWHAMLGELTAEELRTAM